MLLGSSFTQLVRQLPPTQLCACLGRLSAAAFEIMASYQLMEVFHQANQQTGVARCSAGGGGGDEHMAQVSALACFGWAGAGRRP